MMVTTLLALTLYQELVCFRLNPYKSRRWVLLLVPSFTDKGTEAWRGNFYLGISLSPS